MKYVGRFAPSPTGPLHFGSLVAAVASWLDARAAGGEWLVRIEDVDETRTQPGAAEAILGTLEALGLTWDREVVWQSRRKNLYENALECLRAQALIYRCRCSRKELADSGLTGPEGAIYPGTCRDLALSAQVAGADRFRAAAEIGDFIVKRRDGLFAYQLAVVVDDAEQGVTDVVRGADLLWSTPRQIQLQRALGLATPHYLHVPVATNAGGEKLSKQTGAPPIEAAGAGEALTAALAFLGQPRVTPAPPAKMLAEATRHWSVTRIPGGRGV